MPCGLGKDHELAENVHHYKGSIQHVMKGLMITDYYVVFGAQLTINVVEWPEAIFRYNPPTRSQVTGIMTKKKQC